MKNAIFYHAGLSNGAEVNADIVTSLDCMRCHVETVDLEEQRWRLFEAEHAGITSVPALVIDDHVYEIGRGIALDLIADRLRHRMHTRRAV